MKILSISDTHGVLPKPPTEEFDVFIHAGDIAPCVTLLGNIESVHVSFPATQAEIAEAQMKWYADTFVPWINSINAKRKVIIPGNHDLATERFLYRFQNLMDANRIDLLLCSSVDVPNVGIIYGTPYIVPVGRWAWMAPDNNREYLFSLVPQEVDILISHSPPYGICDEVNPGTNIGIPEMNKEFFASRSIGMVLCGHCHESGGVSGIIGDTQVHNISYARTNWQSAGFTIFDKVEGKWIKREN